GTPSSPFRTVTRGLQVAAAGDLVEIGPGIYLAGELWPQSASSPNVAAGVTVRGKHTQTKLYPNTAVDIALVGTGAITLENIYLYDFRHGVVVSTGDQVTINRFTIY